MYPINKEEMVVETICITDSKHSESPLELKDVRIKLPKSAVPYMNTDKRIGVFLYESIFPQKIIA